ncbi:MAG TPA: hypothetical protein VMS09_15485 [Paenibacillus sp.]|uniref:hypothetical protein n=1 Tax=Paenibacillus sp. TaxID=58172 RepID=UPI0028D2D0C3|nr:hypothetical protein [Paenibacillus sp.]HUC93398.1 hypothetical protein [Paenibacillus sp.]
MRVVLECGVNGGWEGDRVGTVFEYGMGGGVGDASLRRIVAFLADPSPVAV